LSVCLASLCECNSSNVVDPIAFISKGDNGKSYLSFNSLMARVISLLTVYNNGEDLKK
jgi:hypothetical protein